MADIPTGNYRMTLILTCLATCLILEGQGIPGCLGSHITTQWLWERRTTAAYSLKELSD